MLKDLTKNAYKLYKYDIDNYNKFFLDNYNLPNGVYILLGIDEEKKKFVIKDVFEKNNKTIDEIMEEKFKCFDKCSFMTDANKVIDTIVKDQSGKKIYSTNAFSLIMKREKLLEVDYNYIINRYIKVLYEQQKFKEMLKIFKTPEELLINKQLYELSEYLKSNKRKEIFNKLIELYTNSFVELQSFAVNKYDNKYNSVYFKFFIEGFDDLLEKERLIYVYSYGFLDNRYNFLNDNKELVGIANIDTSYNSKKPFNFSVTKFKKNIGYVIPYYMISIYTDVYDYIISKSRNKENLINIDFKFSDDSKRRIGKHFYQISGYKNIDDFDIVTTKTDDINFIFKNYINKTIGHKDVAEYTTIKNRFALKKIFFNTFYEKAISEFDILNQIDTIKSQNISMYSKNVFYANKNIFHNYFAFGYDNEFKSKIDKITKELLIGLVKNIEKLDEYKIIKAINLRLSLLNYFNVRKGDIMENKFNQIRINLTNYINQNTNGLEYYQINSIEEFVYLTGQLARYFIDKSEAKDKTFRMLEGVYNCTTIDALKTRIKILFERYSHALKVQNPRFEYLFKALITYQNENQNIKEYQDYLYAGTVGDNIFYLKKGGVDNNE